MKRLLRSILQSAIALNVFIAVAAHAQPTVVADIPDNSTNFVEMGDLVYFTAGEALWRTDGTGGGTIQLRPSGFTQENQWQYAPYGREFDGLFYFVNANSTELWRSDGSAEGTVLLKTFSMQSVRILDTTDSYLFFIASDAATGEEVYRTDGTVSGTILLKDVYPGSTSGYRGVSGALDNQFFFAGDDGVSGTELWKSDGTPAGTVMVEDIYPGVGNGVAPGSNAYSFDGQFYFRGNTPLNGMEPWVSDGTTAGTRILHDINPGPENSGPTRFAIDNNGFLYFLILNDYDEGPAVLWKTAGTTASTSQVAIVGQEGSQNSFHSFLVYRGKVYFWDRTDYFADNLWVTDGTSAGTYTFFNFITIDGSVYFFAVINDYMLFTASAEDVPWPLFRSDGTKEGTTKFRDFKARAPGVYPRDLTKVGDLVFYADHDGFTESMSAHPYSSDDYYQLFQTDAATAESMRTLWGVSTAGTDNITGLNGKVVFTTLNGTFGSTDIHKKLWIYDPSVTPPPMSSFTLVDADSDNDVRRLLDGALISNPDNIPVNIRFDPAETPGSVVFELNGVTVRKETAAPYSLAGDVNGDYALWQDAQPGDYTLRATTYSGSGGQGTPGESLTITFTIECTSPNDNCVPTGEILREVWSGVPGNSVSAIPVETQPDESRYYGAFEGPTNAGTNYGARFRGFVVPPKTGNYTFWIASNDNSELWLSTDDNPANKRKIASVTGATDARQWNKYSSQTSVSIVLTEGVKYYVEALHKQGAGTDHLAVGWQLPGGAMERPIPGNRLAPFRTGSSQSPTVMVTNPVEGQEFSASADILIEAEASDGDEETITVVEFYFSQDGQTLSRIGEDFTAPYSVVWENANPGSYDIYAFAKDTDRNTTGSAPVSITVGQGAGCFASGSITRDFWAGVSGDRVSSVPVNSPPNSTGELTIFEGPSNVGDNYATRIRGYICPPVTGDYTFWIASNDHSELWLSTDDDPTKKKRIASVTGATNARQWNKYVSQASSAIELTQGQRYYIEALHKEGVGTDHIAVGWTLPDGTLERPISGSRLSPFESSQMAAREGQQSTWSQISVYPNPAQPSDRLMISGYEGINETIKTRVEIINMTGDVVFSETVSCGGGCDSYLMKMNEQLVPGLYLVNMETNGARNSKRLLIK